MTRAQPDDVGVEALVGAEAGVEAEVTDAMTAYAVGSGDVQVLATPEVLALVERAAVGAVKGRLPSGRTTVGVEATIAHTAPSPVGVRVRARARITDAAGNRITFAFAVSDPAGLVAEGTHVRVVVDRERFESRVGERSAGP